MVLNFKLYNVGYGAKSLNYVVLNAVFVECGVRCCTGCDIRFSDWYNVECSIGSLNSTSKANNGSYYMLRIFSYSHDKNTLHLSLSRGRGIFLIVEERNHLVWCVVFLIKQMKWISLVERIREKYIFNIEKI